MCLGSSFYFMFESEKNLFWGTWLIFFFRPSLWTWFWLDFGLCGLSTDLPMFLICGNFELWFLWNMALEWLEIVSWRSLQLKVLRRTSLRTYVGEPDITRNPIVCTASSLFHCVFLMNGAHAAPAYVRIGSTYIWRIFRRFWIGMGLFLFSIGYNIPLTAVAFLTIFDMWE